MPSPINRKSIRSEAETRIKAANTAVGQNVFNGKITPNLLRNLPCIGIYTPAEVGENVSRISADQGPVFNSTVDLQIEVLVAQSDAAANKVDDIVTEVQDALFKDATWRELYEGISSKSLQYVVNDDGEKEIATGILTIGLVLAAEEFGTT